MNPIIILPPDTMSREDIEALKANGLCVVEAKEPAAVKFVDPIPAISSRTEIENAAIQLSRRILAPEYWQDGHNNQIRSTIVKTWYEILVKGSPLDPKKSRAEVEREIFDDAKYDEIRRLAREEDRKSTRLNSSHS